MYGRPHYIALGCGLRGGLTGIKLKVTLVKCGSDGQRMNEGGNKVFTFLTAPGYHEILSLSSINDKNDGTYACDYRSPEKRGSYDLHIRIDHIATKGSPFPLFFNEYSSTTKESFEKETTSEAISNSFEVKPGKRNLDVSEKIELAECAKTAVNTALCHIESCSSSNPNLHLQTIIQTALEKAKTQSSLVKVFDISPIVTIDKLHELFSLYGAHKLIEFHKEHTIFTALIKFDTASNANKSLKASGLKVGDRILRVDKWVDPSVQNVEFSSLTIFHSE